MVVDYKVVNMVDHMSSKVVILGILSTVVEYKVVERVSRILVFED